MNFRTRQFWRGQDSNLRRPEGRRVYSPLPLTTRPPLHAYPAHETRIVLPFVEPFPLLEADLWPPSASVLFRISSTPLQTTTSKQDSILVRNALPLPASTTSTTASANAKQAFYRSLLAQFNDTLAELVLIISMDE